MFTPKTGTERAQPCSAYGDARGAREMAGEALRAKVAIGFLLLFGSWPWQWVESSEQQSLVRTRRAPPRHGRDLRCLT